MRSARLPAPTRLGMALCAGVPLVGCVVVSSSGGAAGLLVDLAVALTTVTVGSGAWGLGRWAADRAARESARRWAMLEQVGEEIAWECDARGRFTFVTPQCLAVLGYLPAEARSLSLFDVV